MPASQLNTSEDRIQDEIYRVEGLVAGSEQIYRNSDGYIISGTYNYDGGGSFVYFRNTNNYIVSGTLWAENKTTDFTLYRDSDGYVVSGTKSVS
ncbi:MAG: hypothetical protein ABEK36_04430 [Candidatus Aenigmatarchaeota archaeon]